MNRERPSCRITSRLPAAKDLFHFIAMGADGVAHPHEGFVPPFVFIAHFAMLRADHLGNGVRRHLQPLLMVEENDARLLPPQPFRAQCKYQSLRVPVHHLTGVLWND